MKKRTRRFETVPLAKVPRVNGEDQVVEKLATNEEPYFIPVTSEVAVRSLKRKPGHKPRRQLGNEF